MSVFAIATFRVRISIRSCSGITLSGGVGGQKSQALISAILSVRYAVRSSISFLALTK